MGFIVTQLARLFTVVESTISRSLKRSLARTGPECKIEAGRGDQSVASYRRYSSKMAARRLTRTITPAISTWRG